MLGGNVWEKESCWSSLRASGSLEERAIVVLCACTAFYVKTKKLFECSCIVFYDILVN